MDYSVFIVSSRRPQNVEKFLDGYTWVVRDDEDVQSYKNAFTTYKQPNSKVEIGGKLIHSRNLALELAFADEKICVQISDDIKPNLIRVLTSQTGLLYKDRHFTYIRLDEAIQLLVKELYHTSACLAGVSPTANHMNTNIRKPINNRAFIIGDFIAVKPTELRFDENLSLKEDYDYTLQHLKKYRAVVRLENLMLEFKHYSNAGGAVDYRTTQLEQKNIKYLKEKWGNFVKDNPNRPNEILLNFGKHKKK